MLDPIGRGGELGRLGRWEEARLGRWAGALMEYHRVAAAREHLLGPDHPDTLAAREDKAHCPEQVGRGREAVELYRRVAVPRRQLAAGAF
ncbi:tetratricopeptide repeat protein [Streptomyces sp. TP-A0356]|uniref:tetratricopeptide repeat protein n=1 Tax=Streptomyces sp. TP-A0356 TaxID=1359208 RepID=UPI00352AB95D